MSSASSSAGTLVPAPPGTKSTSRSSGALAKVCVGTMDWLKLDPAVARKLAVETGSSVLAMMYRFTLLVKEKMFSASRGPKTSKAWKPGKTTKPRLTG